MARSGGIQPNEHVPTSLTREKVVAFCCAGYGQEEISQYLGISDDTLRKHYRHELDNALNEVIAEISGIAIRKAREGKEKMIMFVLTHYGKIAKYVRPEEMEANKAAKSLLENLADRLGK